VEIVRYVTMSDEESGAGCDQPSRELEKPPTEREEREGGCEAQTLIESELRSKIESLASWWLHTASIHSTF
jgi:hypothetical protein